MGRRGQSVTLSISDTDKAHLEQIALEQGMTWGDRPNISRLVEAIAQRDLLIGRNLDWARDRIQALLHAMHALIDAGQLPEARLLSELLLERSELTLPMRQDITQAFATTLPQWRQTLDQHIRTQQPFRLSYQDAAQRIWTFTIHHAQITLHEQRHYLDCWCEQTDGNQDLPALAHNWCLRLDRITDAAISPIALPWRSQLDQITVELHLLHGLAFAYSAKPTDQLNRWHPDQPQVRQVLRQTSSTFWLFREVLRYGADCIVISPDPVRDRFRQQVQALAQLYATES